MWRHSMPIGAVAAAIVAGAAATAQAESITVQYTVEIFQQCNFTGVVNCHEFRTSFPMTLSFDTTVINEHAEEGRLTRFYGEPALSDIPLPLNADFPPLSQPRRSAAETARFDPQRGTWVRESLLDIHQNASVDHSDFHRDLQITASGEFAVMPDLDAASFAQFLGTAPFHQFFLGDSIELASGGFELLGYFGQASLDAPPAVTPEPTSLLLLATGMTGLALRRRRQASGAS